MSTLRVNNITDTAGGSSSLSVPGAAEAWVNFNGTGTVAIRAQLNVSSITDNGNGDYTVNFTNAFADASYVVAMQGSGPIAATTWPHIPGFMNTAGTSTPITKTSSAVRFGLFNSNNGNAGYYDSAECGVVVFR